MNANSPPSALSPVALSPRQFPRTCGLACSPGSRGLMDRAGEFRRYSDQEHKKRGLGRKTMPTSWTKTALAAAMALAFAAAPSLAQPAITLHGAVQFNDDH